MYTQPPKKRDRGLNLRVSPIHEYSEATKLAVRHPDNLDSEDEIKKITELNPDVIVVAAYGKILPSKLLKTNHIHLEVKDNNESAKAFYKIMGFKTVGFRSNFYKDGSDALILNKEIDNKS